jgi:valyl-tRNA synthetase
MGPNGLQGYLLEMVLGSRYNFCLFVDEICLESLDEMPDGPVVKILLKSWGRPEAASEFESEHEIHDVHLDWEDGQTNDIYEDVGWMYVETSNYCEWYKNFVDMYNGMDWYTRPPRLRGHTNHTWVDFAMPGTWRKKRGT